MRTRCGLLSTCFFQAIIPPDAPASLLIEVYVSFHAEFGNGAHGQPTRNPCIQELGALTSGRLPAATIIALPGLDRFHIDSNLERVRASAQDKAT